MATEKVESESNSVKQPIGSLAGGAVIVLYCAFTFASWALYPKAYGPVTNWLSDLGNSAYNPRGAILYNLGCILTGIALFPFFVGLHEWYKDEKRFRAGLIVTQAVGCVTAFSLIMIGVFSEDSGWLHSLWSRVFFALNLVVLIQLGSFLFTHPRYRRTIAYYGFIVAAIDVTFIFLDIPLLEWFTVFTALGYVGLRAYNMLQK
jgi:hypothetical membrane protein